jgi:hypothetical protein
MEKIDLKQEFKQYYSPKPGEPELVEPPKMRFVMVDGEGDPNSPEFQTAVGALYSVMYSLKFARKKAGQEPDFSVGALEGLWSVRGGKMFEVGKRDDWLWTLMIWLPDMIKNEEVAAAVVELKVKKPNPALAKVRVEELNEGRCVQIMHVGPYATEPASVKLMTDFAAAQGLTQSGRHHEVYLSDPRRVEPENMRTILRHPVS